MGHWGRETENIYEFAVFGGRFQPFHKAHLAVLRYGLSQANHLIVLCGGARQPPSIASPWDVEIREQMIRGALTEEENERVSILSLMDSPYNQLAWLAAVQAGVKTVVASHCPQGYQPKVLLLCDSKGCGAYLPKLFPQWEVLETLHVNGIDSDMIRRKLFSESEEALDAVAKALPQTVVAYLRRYCDSAVYAHLREEMRYVERYQAAWRQAPYPPVFMTVDAVVVQSGHVLLVTRDRCPGRGLWALPGGFINPEETLEDACLRELKEETGLALPLERLRSAISGRAVFDAPYRSSRGRTITQAITFMLQPEGELPAVRGGDDAAEAFWLPLADLDSRRMFEDHYFIIQHALARPPL